MALIGSSGPSGESPGSFGLSVTRWLLQKRHGSAPGRRLGQDGGANVSYLLVQPRYGRRGSQVPTGARRARSQRTSQLVVAVTGAARGVGLALATRLSRNEDVRRVIAIDDRRGPLDGVTWRILDVRDPIIADRLSGVDTIVHLAVDTSVGAESAGRSALNVRGTQTVLTAAAAAGVRRVVLCTSALVCGVHPDIPVPLPEHARLPAEPHG